MSVHARLLGIARFGALALALVLALTGASAAVAQAGTNTSGQLSVIPGTPLNSITCPAVNQCTAVTASQELTFNPVAFKRPPARVVFRDPGGAAIAGVWCPTITLCTATRVKRAVSFVPRKFRYSPSKLLDQDLGDEASIAVRCPSRTECVSVDSFGDGITYNPQTGKVTTKLINVEQGEALTGLACPSATQCTAVDNAGYQITFQPKTGKRLHGAHIDLPVGLDAPSGASDYELDSVSCPNTRQCAAVDSMGNLVTFNPLTTAASVVTAYGKPFTSISCKPSGLCVAVAGDGSATFGSATSQSPWQTIVVPGAAKLSAVACPSTTECVAVDNNGNAFRITPAA